MNYRCAQYLPQGVKLILFHSNQAGPSHMSNAYLVGHITVKDFDMWAEYCSKVPGTLAPWNGTLVFRGKQVAALAGESSYSDIVVISFPSLAALDSWFSSPAYQSLLPLRQQAADVLLLSYEA